MGCEDLVCACPQQREGILGSAARCRVADTQNWNKPSPHRAIYTSRRFSDKTDKHATDMALVWVSTDTRAAKPGVPEARQPLPLTIQGLLQTVAHTSRPISDGHGNHAGGGGGGYRPRLIKCSQARLRRVTVEISRCLHHHIPVCAHDGSVPAGPTPIDILQAESAGSAFVIGAACSKRYHPDHGRAADKRHSRCQGTMMVARAIGPPADAVF